MMCVCVSVCVCGMALLKTHHNNSTTACLVCIVIVAAVETCHCKLCNIFNLRIHQLLASLLLACRTVYNLTESDFIFHSCCFWFPFGISLLCALYTNSSIFKFPFLYIFRILYLFSVLPSICFKLLVSFRLIIKFL